MHVRHLGWAHYRAGCNTWPDAAVSKHCIYCIFRLEDAHLFSAAISELPPLACFTLCPSLPALSSMAMCCITYVASSKASHSSSSSYTSPRAAAHHARVSTTIKIPFGPPRQSVSHCSSSGTSLETVPSGSCLHFGCSPYHQHCQDNLYLTRSSILGGIEYLRPFLSHPATSTGLSLTSSLPYSSK